MRSNILSVFVTTIIVITLSTNLIYSQNKKNRVKNQAIKTIQEKSPELSILAGVDPLSNDSLQIIQFNDEIIGDEGEDIEELLSENDVVVDIEKLNLLWIAYLSEDDESEFSDNGIKKDEFMGLIIDWLGTPYRFGGNTRKGIDCSSFMRMIYENSLNIELPRTANEQFTLGEEIHRDELQFGDLVFFKTRRYAAITHVGVYLGDDLFAHASSKDGVTISSLNSAYYSRTYRGGKRLTNEDIIALDLTPKTDELIEEVINEEAVAGGN
jgi:hypothetical protein